MKILDIGSALQGYVRELFEVLALGLTLEENERVQDWFRPDGCDRFCVRLEDRDCWIEIGARRPAEIHRSCPAHLCEVVLPRADRRPPALAELLLSGASYVDADRKAAEMLAPLVSLTEMPIQRSLGMILHWAPIFEMAAYGAATAIAEVLDHDRPMLFASIPDVAPKTLRRRYWSKLNLLARLMLLSTPVAARGWLSSMASSFEWTKWTPSWLLLRERSLWLAAIAARAAASFGPGVIESYLETLDRGTIPMKTFDALFGLTAIALDSASEREAIVAGTRKSVSQLDARGALSIPTLHFAAAQAIATMDDPEAARRRSKQVLEAIGGLRKGLFVPDVVARDGTLPTATLEVPAFSVLPFALTAPITEFFPVAASSRPGYRLGLTDAKLGSLVLAAWNGRPEPTAATVH